MHIIPAIDIIDGKCVRLTQGDYSQKKEYNSDPLEVARKFEDAGARRLHLVDLDGARKKQIVNLKVLESIASYTELSIDYGGGIQSEADLRTVFGAGASQVTGGSIAVKNPELFESWLQNFAYRTALSLWPFLWGGGIAIFIAWLTVGYQSIKAASTNPIEALKHEE